MTRHYETYLGYQPTLESWIDTRPVQLTTRQQEIELGSLPASLSLRVEMQPSFADINTEIEAIYDGEPLGGITVREHPDYRSRGFSESAGCTHIDFMWQGKGHYRALNGQHYELNGNVTEEFKILTPGATGERIYRYRFPEIYQGRGVLVAQEYGENSFQNLETKLLNHLRFYSLAGIYNPDMPLEQVSPLFVCPVYVEGSTFPYFKSSYELHQSSGLWPPTLMKIDRDTLVDIHSGSSGAGYKTLLATLETGALSLKVKPRQASSIEFRSTTARRTGLNQIELEFTPS